MKLAAVLVLASLTGCAGFGEITPEQAAILMQMQQSQAASNAAMWQGMQANPLFRPQPVYQPVRPITCDTTHGKYASQTTCW